MNVGSHKGLPKTQVTEKALQESKEMSDGLGDLEIGIAPNRLEGKNGFVRAAEITHQPLRSVRTRRSSERREYIGHSRFNVFPGFLGRSPYGALTANDAFLGEVEHI